MPLIELAPTEYERIRGLIAPLDFNLSLRSLLAGLTPGRVFVDDAARPAAALVEIGYHLFLCGDAAAPGFLAAANGLIRERLTGEAQQAGRDAFLAHAPAAGWDGGLAEALAGLDPLTRARQYYACTRLAGDWRAILPLGFDLLPVEAALSMPGPLENIETLREEMCSERASVEDFLARSFGFCLLRGDEITAWALSEYNTGARCEVGIATAEAYRRQGLGTVTALALVEYALQAGYQEVGWHCWADNTASAALARRAGFEHRHDYTVALCVFDDGARQATHGYYAAQAGEHARALEHYRRAAQSESAPAWVGVEAARSLVKLSQPEAALEQLRQAQARGFGGLARACQHPDFTALRGLPGWDSLFLE